MNAQSTILVGFAALLVGCQAASNPVTRDRTTRAAPSVPALVHNTTIPWDSLHQPMAELSGVTVLEEHLLDTALDRRFKRDNLVLSEEMVVAERSRLLDSVSRTASSLEQIRRERGLGPVRFERLLRRNAMLRALTERSTTLEKAEIEHAYELRFGPRRVCRVIVFSSATQAGLMLNKLRAAGAQEGLEWHFAQAAFEHSLDPSAAAGGLLGAIHPLDPALPQTVRAAIVQTPDGQISSVLLTPAGATLVMPVRTTEGYTQPYEQVAQSLVGEIQNQQQRIRMDELARAILSESRPVILDPGLKWSWDQRALER